MAALPRAMVSHVLAGMLDRRLNIRRVWFGLSSHTTQRECCVAEYLVR
jgi:hypothetical protein